MYSTIIILLFRSVELAVKMDHSTYYWPSCLLIIELLFRPVELAVKMDHSTDYWPSCGLVQYNNHTPV
jgi:hypothetical protein